MDMGNIILKARAKINLSLNVLPDRGAHGYYHVRFINTQAELSDSLSIASSDTPGIRINQQLVDNEENLACRAARIIMERYRIRKGIEMTIEKHIPSRAGLGGGSSDAGAVINAMASLFRIQLPEEERNEIAQMLGMDVCYCVIGGLCTVGGIGERVERLRSTLPSLTMLIATPPEQKPSTAWAYSLLREDEMGRCLERYDALLNGIEHADLKKITENLHNDFELPMGRHYPIIGSMKKTMLEEGALGALLAGSGLSVFGIFGDTRSRQRAVKKLEATGVHCFKTETISQRSS